MTEKRTVYPRILRRRNRRRKTNEREIEKRKEIEKGFRGEVKEKTFNCALFWDYKDFGVLTQHDTRYVLFWGGDISKFLDLP